jgi:serine/threonine protein kinase
MGCQVSTLGDVYSFGILVLEILTGRKPTDKMFTNGMNLHWFVKVSLPDKLLERVDSTLLPRESRHLHPNDVKQCLLKLSYIGLACTSESPKERMSIKDVTRELDKIRISLSKR